jgi:Carboxypeptidase regulatory-like domain
MSCNRAVPLGNILPWLVICLSLLLTISTSPVWAQSTSTGTLFGVVTDPTGAAVVGAAVTMTDTSTGLSRTIDTNETGRYIFVNVAPGKYDLSITKKGFAAVKMAGQTVEVGKTVTVDATLRVGATTEVVEVQANNVDLQTTNATVGNTITGVALDSLPSLGRDVSTFVTLQPGISPDGSVAGTAVDQSSFQLDGGNNTNDMDGSMSVYTTTFSGDPTGGVANQGNGYLAAGPTGVVPTPSDSVEEFKVGTTGQTADFNSSAGAQVQVVTKRGTNAWHGTAYEYYLENNFSANTWQNNQSGVPLPSFHYNRFGGAIGGPILPKLLGGKTYFFANYQGFRWPNSQTVEKTVPSAAMRLGLLTDANTGTIFNLNPTAVTFNGTTYPGTALDPRAIGINPLISQLWSKYEPASNESTCGLAKCDKANVQGFLANVTVPQKDNFGVVRLDHDFGDKWHFMSSYRYYHLTAATVDQVDIGGFFPGDTLGVPASQSNNPQAPWYLVAGMTTNITSNTTNDFHYSFLRNWWQWGRAGDTIQFPGLGGALEPFGEDRKNVLAPYNVNTQSTRTRFWDGKDHMFRDDVSMLKGNHLFQFGGIYQHNFNWHSRTDNGGGINYQPVYQLGTTSGAGTGVSVLPPAGWTGTAANWGRDYAATLGIVSASQIAYTRSGPNLTLNPPLTPAFDQSTIPFYNVYFSDTWHMKPTFTLTYGLGWTLEMPPVEKDGKQVEFVDAADQPIDTQAYLAARERAALLGQVYNPIVGFALVGNTANGLKYPYHPFYGSFSPRIAVAWNPHFESDSWSGKIFGHDNTVIRGGYSRIYGRLNGVDLVLVPLLGTGLIQPVQCFAPTIAGVCGGTSTPTTAFRVGVDGNTAPLAMATPTLPQPDFPGINAASAGAGEALDPNFRPNVVDAFDFTVQRQLSSKLTLEVGYIGRRITHEYQPINVNSVPYMMTLGGQTFAKAYANTVLQYCGGIAGLAGSGCAKNAAAVTPQPFFETALAGTGYCTGFANCTQAVVANEGGKGGNLTTQSVWSLWSDMDNGGFNFPRSMLNTPVTPGGLAQLSSGVGVNASIGYGNYNAGFASLKMNDWRGLTMQSNFTWSKALGTGAVYQATSADTPVDPFNLHTGYGLQGFDRKFVYNMFFVYQPPFYKGQKGVVGRVLGGWTFAPVFAAGTGLPLPVATLNGGGQAFGEGDSNSFVGNGNTENAILMGTLQTGSAHYNTPGGGGGFNVNLFKDPAAAYNQFRQPILGYDTRDGGFATGVRGFNYWNMDLSIKKAVNITERVSTEFQIVFANLLNHDQLLDPILDTSNFGAWGSSLGEGDNSNNNGGQRTPRTMEFGFRVRF